MIDNVRLANPRLSLPLQPWAEISERLRRICFKFQFDSPLTVAALDRQRRCGQDRSAMLFSRFVPLLLLLAALSVPAFAQGFKKELEAPEKVSLSVKNLDGRVSVVASADQQKKVSIEAKSTGLPVAPDDVKVETKGS